MSFRRAEGVVCHPEKLKATKDFTTNTVLLALIQLGVTQNEVEGKYNVTINPRRYFA